MVAKILKLARLSVIDPFNDRDKWHFKVPKHISSELLFDKQSLVQIPHKIDFGYLSTFIRRSIRGVRVFSLHSAKGATFTSYMRFFVSALQLVKSLLTCSCWERIRFIRTTSEQVRIE